MRVFSVGGSETTIYAISAVNLPLFYRERREIGLKEPPAAEREVACPPAEERVIWALPVERKEIGKALKP